MPKSQSKSATHVIGRHDYTNKENESSVITDSQNIVISLDESFNTLWELYK